VNRKKQTGREIESQDRHRSIQGIQMKKVGATGPGGEGEFAPKLGISEGTLLRNWGRGRRLPASGGGGGKGKRHAGFSASAEILRRRVIDVPRTPQGGPGRHLGIGETDGHEARGNFENRRKTDYVKNSAKRVVGLGGAVPYYDKKKNLLGAKERGTLGVAWHTRL